MNDTVAKLLDLHCRNPLERWEVAGGECRVERRKNPIAIRQDYKHPLPYSLHWVRWINGIYERRSMKFATLDELYEWARQHGLTANESQISLGI